MTGNDTAPTLQPCGALDVGDVRRLISTAAVPRKEWLSAVDAATASPAFDGANDSSELSEPIIFGPTTIAKAQHREHERLESARWFGNLRRDTSIVAPRLHDTGTVRTASGVRWWLVLERMRGTESSRPTPVRLRTLGQQLRIWHECSPAHGLRLDDPGALGVLLGELRARLPNAYILFSQAFADICKGLPMRAVHGDVAVGHNTLYQDDELSAILDPGAVHVAPPMLDLAWCLAVDLPRGAQREPLLEGYGKDAADKDLIDALLPAMMLRRMLDTERLNRPVETRWLHGELQRRSPGLLSLTGLPPGPV